ncbi:hypothetical protein GCM10011578_076670 [Streptomyces fuscichromogenes]|uniref:Uncharacterized protein n=1 Tax=Streptomyces fuscichromogenes TaxID=1324013 RepID=A0A917XLM8_9ACTN|nr:hypothetical protein GCM10011578_076670 [Streptomyces fuscichromogenes]
MSGGPVRGAGLSRRCLPVGVRRRPIFPYLFTRIPFWSVDRPPPGVKGASTPGTPGAAPAPTCRRTEGAVRWVPEAE